MNLFVTKKCPFDEIVYLNSKEKCKFYYDFKLIELNKYKLNSVTATLMPISVSTYCMPFFLDIFKPSLLNLLTVKVVQILLELKSKYKPQIYLDNENFLNSYILEDILWNCFAIFKFKFSVDYKKGFLNYFFSVFCVLKYFEVSIEGNQKSAEIKYQIRSKISKIKQLIPCFIEALILNGLLIQKDLKFFLNLNFIQLVKNSPNSRLEIEFSQEAVAILKQLSDKHSILRLSDLCRIKMKQVMKYFSMRTVHELNLSDKLKQFILFDQEFADYHSIFKS